MDGLEEKIFITKYKVKLPSREKIKKAIKNYSFDNKNKDDIFVVEYKTRLLSEKEIKKKRNKLK